MREKDAAGERRRKLGRGLGLAVKGSGIPEVLLIFVMVAFALWVVRWIWIGEGLGEAVWRMGSEPETFTRGVFSLLVMVAVIFVVARILRLYRRRVADDATEGLRSLDRAVLKPATSADDARHEAVHAVAATALGLQVTEVRTVGVHGATGRFTTRGTIASAAEASFAQMVIALAPHVDELDRGLTHAGDAVGDLRSAIELAYVVQAHRRSDTLEEILASGRDRARAIIAANSPQIEELTARLLTPFHVVSGEDLDQELSAVSGA